MIKHAQQAAVAGNVKMTMPTTDSAVDAHIAPAPRVSVQAFCETVETAAAVQAAGEDRRLAKAHVKIQMGGITAATEAYRNSPTPNVILIETDNRTDDILKGLDQLAEVCDSGTRVVVLGRVNDVRLYRELTRRGVSEYLMTPVGTIDVVRAVCNLFSAPDAKAVGRIMAVVGSKGGVGASTVAHNIAWGRSVAIWASSRSLWTSILPSAPPDSTTIRILHKGSRMRCSRPTASTRPSLIVCCRNVRITSACWLRQRLSTGFMILRGKPSIRRSILCAAQYPASFSMFRISGRRGRSEFL